MGCKKKFISVYLETDDLLPEVLAGGAGVVLLLLLLQPLDAGLQGLLILYCPESIQNGLFSNVLSPPKKCYAAYWSISCCLKRCAAFCHEFFGGPEKCATQHTGVFLGASKDVRHSVMHFLMALKNVRRPILQFFLCITDHCRNNVTVFYSKTNNIVASRICR